MVYQVYDISRWTFTTSSERIHITILKNELVVNAVVYSGKLNLEEIVGHMSL